MTPAICVESLSARTKIETEYPAMGYQQSFSSKDGKPGLLLVHGKGNVFVRELKGDQRLDVAVQSLLAWTGKNRLTFQNLQNGNGFLASHKHEVITAHVSGPSKVWIMSGSNSEDFFQHATIDDFNGAILIE